MVFSAPIGNMEHAKSDKQRHDDRRSRCCGKMPQNAARQRIIIGAMVTAERIIWESILRHPDTPRLCTAIASLAGKNWRLTEGRQRRRSAYLAIMNAESPFRASPKSARLSPQKNLSHLVSLWV
jgi:hypothetical protein